MVKNTINQTQLKNNNGWQLCPQSATYASANSIVFTGTTIDNTISKGMKLKLTNDGTVKYYTIVSFATAGPDRGMGLSGPVALVSGSITNLYFSTEDQPYGLSKAWISWTPAWTNLAPGNGVLDYAKYTINGKTVSFKLRFVWGSTTSCSGTLILSLPITAHSDEVPATGINYIGLGNVLDAGSNQFMLQSYTQSTTQFAMSVLAAGGSFASTTPVNATIPMTWTTNDALNIRGQYEAA